MMNIESSIAVKDHKEKANRLAEVLDVERQLWTYTHSRELLNADVQNLYRTACSLYEKILLGNNELEELQEIEYSLWKLHYKHIDEFRKQTSQNSGKEETKTSKNHENVLEGFKLFLRESSTFYQALISKIKRFYDVSSQVDQSRLHKCRFLCHRLLVRVGDLARYVQVQEKYSSQEKNWSVAAKHYLEAAKMYPDGGNPHNQLAWLATYIGDEFLALYHCIRSLAVKEPFPDASNNLSVIFERNQSTQINSLSIEAEFDFLKPSETVKLQPSESGCSVGTDFWPLLVRMTSLFFLEYNLECFSCTFGSTIRSMEALLAHDDVTLSTALESYQNVNLTRSGPYRVLQLVSVLIFTIQNQTKTPEIESLKLQMSFAVMFIIMGRVLERCLKGDNKNPLLPAVLVFSEWLVEEVLDKLVKIEMEEKLSCATSYFFTSYVRLLNRLVDCLGQVRFSDHAILWEDNEMRGYNPISQRHLSFEDLSTLQDQENNKTDFRAQNEHRVQRIIEAAIKLANDDAQRWILYENFGGKFCMKEAIQRKTLKLEGKLAVVEEEEDIVFKPISRYNSAPLPACLTQKERISQENSANLDANLQSSSDESLRRASSLLIAQNRALIGALTSAGPGPPPSLSSWVLNDDRIGKKPIDEIALESLSLDKQEERFGFVEAFTSTESSSSTHHPHHNYRPPAPSAPLLPEDATWISGPTTKASSFIHPAPEWLLLRKENQNHNNGMQQQQFFGSPCYPGNIYIQQASSRFDGWGYPIQPVYAECLHPAPPLLINEFYDQRNVPYMDVRADQQMQLLQYLKEKEMRIQQDAHSAAYTRNS